MITDFHKWLKLREQADPRMLMSIYEKIAGATGIKGSQQGNFTGEFLKLRAGLSDQEVKMAMDVGFIVPNQGGMTLNQDMVNQISQQSGVNPQVPGWAQRSQQL